MSQPGGAQPTLCFSCLKKPSVLRIIGKGCGKDFKSCATCRLPVCEKCLSRRDAVDCPPCQAAKYLFSHVAKVQNIAVEAADEQVALTRVLRVYASALAAWTPSHTTNECNVIDAARDVIDDDVLRLQSVKDELAVALATAADAACCDGVDPYPVLHAATAADPLADLPHLASLLPPPTEVPNLPGSSVGTSASSLRREPPAFAALPPLPQRGLGAPRTAQFAAALASSALKAAAPALAVRLDSWSCLSTIAIGPPAYDAVAPIASAAISRGALSAAGATAGAAGVGSAALVTTPKPYAATGDAAGGTARDAAAATAAVADTSVVRVAAVDDVAGVYPPAASDVVWVGVYPPGTRRPLVHARLDSPHRPPTAGAAGAAGAAGTVAGGVVGTPAHGRADGRTAAHTSPLAAALGRSLESDYAASPTPPQPRAALPRGAYVGIARAPGAAGIVAALCGAACGGALIDRPGVGVLPAVVLCVPVPQYAAAAPHPIVVPVVPAEAPLARRVTAMAAAVTAAHGAGVPLLLLTLYPPEAAPLRGGGLAAAEAAVAAVGVGGFADAPVAPPTVAMQYGGTIETASVGVAGAAAGTATAGLPPPQALGAAVGAVRRMLAALVAGGAAYYELGAGAAVSPGSAAATALGGGGMHAAAAVGGNGAGRVPETVGAATTPSSSRGGATVGGARDVSFGVAAAEAISFAPGVAPPLAASAAMPTTEVDAEAAARGVRGPYAAAGTNTAAVTQSTTPAGDAGAGVTAAEVPPVLQAVGARGVGAPHAEADPRDCVAGFTISFVGGRVDAENLGAARGGPFVRPTSDPTAIFSVVSCGRDVIATAAAAAAPSAPPYGVPFSAVADAVADDTYWTPVARDTLSPRWEVGTTARLVCRPATTVLRVEVLDTHGDDTTSLGVAAVVLRALPAGQEITLQLYPRPGQTVPATGRVTFTLAFDPISSHGDTGGGTHSSPTASPARVLRGVGGVITALVRPAALRPPRGAAEPVTAAGLLAGVGAAASLLPPPAAGADGATTLGAALDIAATRVVISRVEVRGAPPGAPVAVAIAGRPFEPFGSAPCPTTAAASAARGGMRVVFDAVPRCAKLLVRVGGPTSAAGAVMLPMWRAPCIGTIAVPLASLAAPPASSRVGRAAPAVADSMARPAAAVLAAASAATAAAMSALPTGTVPPEGSALACARGSLLGGLAEPDDTLDSAAPPPEFAAAVASALVTFALEEAFAEVGCDDDDDGDGVPHGAECGGSPTHDDAAERARAMSASKTCGEPTPPAAGAVVSSRDATLSTVARALVATAVAPSFEGLCLESLSVSGTRPAGGSAGVYAVVAVRPSPLAWAVPAATVIARRTPARDRVTPVDGSTAIAWDNLGWVFAAGGLSAVPEDLRDANADAPVPPSAAPPASAVANTLRVAIFDRGAAPVDELLAIVDVPLPSSQEEADALPSVRACDAVQLAQPGGDTVAFVRRVATASSASAVSVAAVLSGRWTSPAAALATPSSPRGTAESTGLGIRGGYAADADAAAGTDAPESPADIRGEPCGAIVLGPRGIGARDVLAMDVNAFGAGTSDPYLVVTFVAAPRVPFAMAPPMAASDAAAPPAAAIPWSLVHGGDVRVVAKLKTATRHRTVNPRWVDTALARIPLTTAANVVRFEVFDEDTESTDDPLGVAALPIRALLGDDVVVPLERGHYAIEPTGHLIVNAMVDTSCGRRIADQAVANGASFGRLVIRDIACRSLRAADFALLRAKATSDPYIVLTVYSPAGPQTRRTRVLKRTLDPIWNERSDVLEIPLTDRCSEYTIEVFDWDRVGGDDPLGEFRDIVPSVTRRQRVTRALTTPTACRDRVSGSISFTVETSYDSVAEWRGAWLTTADPAVAAAAAAPSTAPQPVAFSIGLTRDAVTSIARSLLPLAALWRWIQSVLLWDDATTSSMCLIVAVIVGYYGLYLQAALGAALYALQRSKRSKELRKAAPLDVGPAEAAGLPRSTLPIAGMDALFSVIPATNAATTTSPTSAAALTASPPPVSSDARVLGLVTYALRRVAVRLQMMEEIAAWESPQQTRAVYYALLGVFVVSFVVPPHIAALGCVAAVFGVVPLYVRHPLLLRRVPPQSLAAVAATRWLGARAPAAAARVRAVLAMCPPVQVRGRVMVRVLEAQALRNADSGILGDVSDPFCLVECNDLRIGRTRVIANELNPRWDATIGPHVTTGRVVRLCVGVWDEDASVSPLGGDDESLGEATVMVPIGTKETTAWLRLVPTRGATGAAMYPTGRIKVEYSYLPV